MPTTPCATARPEPGPPSIVSTVKINQAGFTEMMDTEAMFRKWFSAGAGEPPVAVAAYSEVFATVPKTPLPSPAAS